tara:strand:+ start:87 stop:260 length:174 start_codon:yes stop_codon:yes gene_type:complete
VVLGWIISRAEHSIEAECGDRLPGAACWFLDQLGVRSLHLDHLVYTINIDAVLIPLN